MPMPATANDRCSFRFNLQKILNFRLLSYFPLGILFDLNYFCGFYDKNEKSIKKNDKLMNLLKVSHNFGAGVFRVNQASY